MSSEKIRGHREAARRAGCSHTTVKRWAERIPGVAEFKRGVWWFDPARLDDVVRAYRIMKGLDESA